MTCIRCHAKPALTERRRVILSQDVGRDLPADVCFKCLFEDPAYHDALMGWTLRKRDETIRRFQDVISRPLELIDRWVDSFRE
jgi:hypothetical protein